MGGVGSCTVVAHSPPQQRPAVRLLAPAPRPLSAASRAARPGQQSRPASARPPPAAPPAAPLGIGGANACVRRMLLQRRPPQLSGAAAGCCRPAAPPCWLQAAGAECAQMRHASSCDGLRVQIAQAGAPRQKRRRQQPPHLARGEIASPAHASTRACSASSRAVLSGPSRLSTRRDTGPGTTAGASCCWPPFGASMNRSCCWGRVKLESCGAILSTAHATSCPPVKHS